MNTKSAIQAMLNGKKVRRPSWVEGDYFMFDGECFITEDATVVMADFNGNDWEIYEEPKPKQTVTIEKWLLKMQGTEQYAIEEGSKEEMNTWGKYKTDAWQKVKLLDTYEVEL